MFLEKGAGGKGVRNPKPSTFLKTREKKKKFVFHFESPGKWEGPEKNLTDHAPIDERGNHKRKEC